VIRRKITLNLFESYLGSLIKVEMRKLFCQIFLEKLKYYSFSHPNWYKWLLTNHSQFCSRAFKPS